VVGSGSQIGDKPPFESCKTLKDRWVGSALQVGDKPPVVGLLAVVIARGDPPGRHVHHHAVIVHEATTRELRGRTAQSVDGLRGMEEGSLSVHTERPGASFIDRVCVNSAAYKSRASVAAKTLNTMSVPSAAGSVVLWRWPWHVSSRVGSSSSRAAAISAQAKALMTCGARGGGRGVTRG
jgi:hypothetical protein